MSGLAAGLAMEGHIIFTYSIGNFPTLRCLEQIRNDICYHNANVKIVCIGGGMSYGAVGFSHHATEDLAILRSLPGMLVLSPCDLWEAAEAARYLVSHRGPAYLRLDKSAAPATVRLGEVFRPGCIRTVRKGSDVTLAATGGILAEALLAADALAEQGVLCRVLNVHTIKPIDTDTLCGSRGGDAAELSVSRNKPWTAAWAALLLKRSWKPGILLASLSDGLRNTFSRVVGSQRISTDCLLPGCRVNRSNRVRELGIAAEVLS